MFESLLSDLWLLIAVTPKYSTLAGRQFILISKVVCVAGIVSTHARSDGEGPA